MGKAKVLRTKQWQAKQDAEAIKKEIAKPKSLMAKDLREAIQ